MGLWPQMVSGQGTDPYISLSSPLVDGPLDLPHRQLEFSTPSVSILFFPTCPKLNRVLLTNTSLGTLFLFQHNQPSTARVPVMPTAIADLNKPIAGATTMQHLATESHSSIQHVERRARVIYHPEMRERTATI